MGCWEAVDGTSGRCAERLWVEILKGASATKPRFAYLCFLENFVKLQWTFQLQYQPVEEILWADYVRQPAVLSLWWSKGCLFCIKHSTLLEGIIAEKDIQVISLPRGSSQVRLTCIFSAPFIHCRLQLLQGFPEGSSLRVLCSIVHWQSGWLLHCQ